MYRLEFERIDWVRDWPVCVRRLGDWRSGRLVPGSVSGLAFVVGRKAFCVWWWGPGA